MVVVWALLRCTSYYRVVATAAAVTTVFETLGRFGSMPMKLHHQLETARPQIRTDLAHLVVGPITEGPDERLGARTSKDSRMQ